MNTWLIDTPLLKLFGSPKAVSLMQWIDEKNALLYVSAASLTEVALGIKKMPASRAQRAKALRDWLDSITSSFPDRIHPIDAQISVRAGELMPSLTNDLVRHRFHNAILVATAQTHGHGLCTRRDEIFGPWTNVPIATI